MSTTLTCTISGVSYPIKQGDGYGSFLDAYKALEVRGSLDITIIDYAGTFSFVYGQPVVLSDSIKGTIFKGFVGTDKPTKLGPASATIEHALTCFDKQYLVDKRTNYSNYLNWYAGDIMVDFVQNTLSAEGVTVAAAMRRETTINNFSAGTLSGTVATLNDNGDDGSLELVAAGSDVSSNVDLSTGTLTNVTYADGNVTPTLTPTIKLASTLVTPFGNPIVYVTIWTGSITIHTSNTLVFDVFVPSTNPQISGALDITFSDQQRMNNATIGTVTDQNSLPSYQWSGNNFTDLSDYAEDQWYHRTLTFPSAYNGKVATSIQVGLAGSSAGSYAAYFKNIILSGNTIFSSTIQTTPFVSSSDAFTANLTNTTLVQSYDPAITSYVSGAINIDPVKSVRSSLVTFSSTNLDKLTIYASYDGNSYITCITNSALPSLPAGSNVSSVSVTFKALFPSGTDPTTYAALNLLSVSLQSAPNATKSDVTASYGTQTAWNTGTKTNVQSLSNGDLMVSTFSQNWSGLSTSGQTLFTTSGPTPTESASIGAYVLTMPDGSIPISRMDNAGSAADFTLDVDLKFSSAQGVLLQAGIVYRTVAWGNGLQDIFGYLVSIDSSQIQFGYGSNTNDGVDGYTAITSVSQTLSANTTYHVKIIVIGTSHKIYFNGATTPTISQSDTHYVVPGQFGLRGFNGSGSSRTCTWDNLVITPAPTGTWVSPSTSISSLGTIDGSVIAWTEVNTENPNASSIQVQTSIDGGATYNACTNGDVIPGLTAGTNVSGKSVLIKATLNTIAPSPQPILRWLYYRVLGAYPGSSGTRTTAPIGIDYVDRANQANWGTASDGQTWAKTGTGTAAVASNTLTITTTTGDVYERLGSLTGTDMDETVPFKLSGSADIAGMTLRYVDANNHYKIAVSTANITISKKLSGVVTTLAIGSLSLSTNTWYYLRFRVVGMSPVLLYGNVWLQGTLEPTIDSTTYQWDDSNWTITASD